MMMSKCIIFHIFTSSTANPASAVLSAKNAARVDAKDGH